ncbi:type II secretion system protein GspD [Aliarcobacter vitoriensis]|uniref:type II secretion system protein GspD n=1 Tax=Aliarcobacter vitoriensis TaxID=2011099 RepID=UPI003AB06A13
MKRFLKIFFILIISTNCFSSDKIDINFSNLHLNELIKISSKILNKDILVSENFDIKVNFFSNRSLKKSELLNILKSTLNDNGYMLEDNGTFFKIVKIQEPKKEPYSTKIYELKNVDGENILKILTTLIDKNSFENEHIKPIVTLDSESNSIILMGVEPELNKLTNLLDDIDKQKSQVYIQAKIIEVNNEMVNKIGLSYGILRANSSSDGIMAISTNLNGGSNALNEAISSFAWNIGNLNIKSGIAFGASLNLLRQQGAVDIVSEPSILAINNKESFIYVGEKISVQTSSTVTDGGTQRTNFQREDVGLTLKVKPRVASDEKLTLEISALIEGIKLKSVGVGDNPDTHKKEINTTAILNNGESVIIGGLIENKSENVEDKVPLLGDIPVVGNIFRNETNVNKKNNLVIIVTPYLVPKNKDLTYIRDKLTELKNLEDRYLEESLQSLQNNKEEKKDKVVTINQKEKLDEKTLHEKRLKEFFEEHSNNGF